MFYIPAITGYFLTAFTLSTTAETYSGDCGAAGSDLTWTLDTELGECKITGTGTMRSYRFDAPWYDYRDQIRSLIVCDGVESIGSSAFYACEQLTYLSLPESLSVIGDSAFKSCGALQTLVIGDGVTEIGDEAFLGCINLNELTFGRSLNYIGRYTFKGCNRLCHIVLPDSCVNFSVECFADCKNLESIVIGPNITVLPDRCFDGCNRLTDVYYRGSSEEYSQIRIFPRNGPFEIAVKHFDFGAISQEQHDKSLHDLTVKMGYGDKH